MRRPEVEAKGESQSGWLACASATMRIQECHRPRFFLFPAPTLPGERSGSPRWLLFPPVVEVPMAAFPAGSSPFLRLLQAAWRQNNPRQGLLVLTSRRMLLQKSHKNKNGRRQMQIRRWPSPEELRNVVLRHQPPRADSPQKKATGTVGLQV